MTVVSSEASAQQASRPWGHRLLHDATNTQTALNIAMFFFMIIFSVGTQNEKAK